MKRFHKLIIPFSLVATIGIVLVISSLLRRNDKPDSKADQFHRFNYIDAPVPTDTLIIESLENTIEQGVPGNPQVSPDSLRTQ